MRVCPVLTWGHAGKPRTSQLGPVGAGRALSDSDSRLGLRQCGREDSFPNSAGSSGDRPGRSPPAARVESGPFPSSPLRPLLGPAYG